jgi:hypothetical protein
MRLNFQTCRVPLRFSAGLASGLPSTMEKSCLFISTGQARPTFACIPWERTDQLDSGGYYVARKHAIVTFILNDIRELELDGFSHQNVLPF